MKKPSGGIQPLTKKQRKQSRFWNAVVRADWKHGQKENERRKLLRSKPK